MRFFSISFCLNGFLLRIFCTQLHSNSSNLHYFIPKLLSKNTGGTIFVPFVLIISGCY